MVYDLYGCIPCNERSIVIRLYSFAKLRSFTVNIMAEICLAHFLCQKKTDVMVSVTTDYKESQLS